MSLLADMFLPCLGALPGQAALRAALQGQGRGGAGCAPQCKPGDTEAAGEGMERGLAMGKGDKGMSRLTALLLHGSSPGFGC